MPDDQEPLHQGDFLDADRMIGVIVDVADVVHIARENGYTISRCEARAMLEKNGKCITEGFLYDWTAIVWAACQDEIEEQGVPIT